MPSAAFGLWKISRDTTADIVYEAIRAGYRHIDSACDYGNEKEAGEGIARAIADGLVTREELWVTSKLWNTYHAAEHVPLAMRRTLDDLGLEYLDLYLVHFPIALRFVPFEVRYPPEWFFDPGAEDPHMEPAWVPMSETWRAMEALADAGLARNIGLSNFNVQGVRDVLSYAVIPPAVLQVELHAYNQQNKLLRFCREAGIAVFGFSPLGAGSYVEIGMAEARDSVLQNETVIEIADRLKKTPAQIVLRWSIQRGTGVVVKTSKISRMSENLAGVGEVGWELSPRDVARIRGLDQGRRFNDPGEFAEAAFNTFFPIYE